MITWILIIIVYIVLCYGVTVCDKINDVSKWRPRDK
jgi:hypothetical protein